MDLPGCPSRAVLQELRDGRYIRAFEELRPRWRVAQGAERLRLGGWMLLAAALFHRDRGNRRGTDLCFGRAAHAWRDLLAEGGPAELADVLAAVERVLPDEWSPLRLPGDDADGPEGEGEEWDGT